MELASQANRRQHQATFGLDIPLQVRKRAAHAHKVIDKNVFASHLNHTGEFSLARQPRKTVGSRVGDHIDLGNTQIVRPAKGFADFNRKVFRDGIDAFPFIGVGTDQSGRMSSQQVCKPQIVLHTHGVIDERSRGCAAPLPAFAAP